MECDFKCFSGHPAVKAKRPVPLKTGFERFSASFGFAAKRELQRRKRFMSANEGNSQSSQNLKTSLDKVIMPKAGKVEKYNEG